MPVLFLHLVILSTGHWLFIPIVPNPRACPASHLWVPSHSLAPTISTVPASQGVYPSLRLLYSLPPKLCDNEHLLFCCDIKQLKGPMIYNLAKKVYHERMPSRAHWQGPGPVLPSPIHMSLPCPFLHLSHWLPPPPHSSSMCLSALPSLPLPSHPPPRCCCRLGAGGYENELRAQETVIIC